VRIKFRSVYEGWLGSRIFRFAVLSRGSSLGSFKAARTGGTPPLKRNSSIALAVLFTIGVSVVLQAQKTEKEQPTITVEDVAITVSPGKPIGPEDISPGTLCNLKVKLRNLGTQKASTFGFGLKINGKEMTVHDKMLCMQTVDPGTTGEITLSNFYSTEPGGELPKDGKVTVEVTLKQAQWVEIKKEGNTEVSTPLGEVKGLPFSKSVSKPLKPAL